MDNGLVTSGIHRVVGGECGPGTYCPNGTALPVPCAPGTYNPIAGQPLCFPCPAGHYCLNGTIAPTLCPMGNYCPQGSGVDRGRLCPAGAYNVLTGLQNLTQCQLCPGGSYCPIAGMNFDQPKPTFPPCIKMDCHCRRGCSRLGNV